MVVGQVQFTRRITVDKQQTCDLILRPHGFGLKGETLLYTIFSLSLLFRSPLFTVLLYPFDLIPFYLIAITPYTLIALSHFSLLVYPPFRNYYTVSVLRNS